VIVFRYPDGSSDDWVKRLIGLPGDRIQMIGGVVHHQRPGRYRRCASPTIWCPITPNSPLRYVDPQAAGSVTNEVARFCSYPRYRANAAGRAVPIDVIDS
jgi:signal peptidase I